MAGKCHYVYLTRIWRSQETNVGRLKEAMGNGNSNIIVLFKQFVYFGFLNIGQSRIIGNAVRCIIRSDIGITTEV